MLSFTYSAIAKRPVTIGGHGQDHHNGQLFHIAIAISSSWNVNKNRTFVSPLFIITKIMPNQNRPAPSSVFRFSNTGTLVSYCSPTRPVTIFFSTFDQHKKKRLDKDDVNMRLQLIQFYNPTRGIVDTIDKMRNQYATAHISRHWQFFFAMLDIRGINATVLYQLNKDKEVTSSDVKNIDTYRYITIFFNYRYFFRYFKISI